MVWSFHFCQQSADCLVFLKRFNTSTSKLLAVFKQLILSNVVRKNKKQEKRRVFKFFILMANGVINIYTIKNHVLGK